MTVAQRIDWAKRLITVQLVLNVVVLLVGILAGTGAITSNALNTGGTVGLAIPGYLIALAGLIGVILPIVALVAMEKRTQIWGIVLYAVLAYQVISGGGLMSLLPLVALIFLIDKETYQELTGARGMTTRAEAM